MKLFNHQRPIRDPGTDEILGWYDAPISRMTVDPLGGQFGCEKRKRLVVTLKRGDVIELRPEKTRRTVTITAVDLYRYMLRLQAQRAILEKARERKIKLQDRRESQRIARADSKLRREAREEREQS